MNGRAATYVPISRADWKRMLMGIKRVLTTPSYLVLASAVSVASLGLFVLPTNSRLVWDVVLFGRVEPTTRLTVLLALFPFVGGTSTPVLDLATVFVSALTGVTVATFAYRLSVRGDLAGLGSGSVGVTLATLGGGCVACGSVLAAVFGISAVGALAVLPFDGLEIFALAAVLLVISLYTLTQQFVP